MTLIRHKSKHSLRVVMIVFLKLATGATHTHTHTLSLRKVYLPIVQGKKIRGKRSTGGECYSYNNGRGASERPIAMR